MVPEGDVEVVSSHFLNPFDTSAVVISVDIAPAFFTLSGMANDVRNSLSMWSCPVHCSGICPDRTSDASRERLLNVRLSYDIVPFPQGEAAAAQKELRLKRRRFALIDSLSKIVSQMMSSSDVVARNVWKFSGYSVWSR